MIVVVGADALVQVAGQCWHTEGMEEPDGIDHLNSGHISVPVLLNMSAGVVYGTPSRGRLLANG